MTTYKVTKYERPDGIYSASFKLPGQRKKAVSLSTRDKAEAETKRAALELQINGGAIFNIPAPVLTAPAPAMGFADFADKYLSWFAGEYPATAKGKRENVNASLIGHFQNKPIDKITVLDIEEWKQQRLQADIRRTYKAPDGTYRTRKGKGKINPNSVAGELRTLKAMLNKAVKWELLDKNRAADVNDPVNLNDKRREFLSATQLGKLIAASNGYYSQIWLLAANTGLRRGELLNLTHGDIHIDGIDDYIIVRSTNERRTKSGKTRTVYLADDAIAAIQELRLAKLTTQQRYLHDKGRFEVEHASTDYLLKQVGGNTLRQSFKACCRKAGIGEGFVLHSLRHTFISAYVNAPGNTLQDAQELAGHARLETTMIYVHVRPDSMKRGVKNLKF